MTRPKVCAVAADAVFDGSALHRHAAVRIEDDSITWIGSRGALPVGISLHELPDRHWLAPGFIDTQVNGGGDVLFNDDPHPAALARIVAAHRRYGTTGLMATLISDTAKKMRAALNAVQNFPGHGVLGIHFEGPFLSQSKPGVHDPTHLRLPAGEDLELFVSPSPILKLITLAPEQVPRGFIAELVKAGTRVSLGHSMASYDETKTAIEEGLTGFTHLFNAMRPLSARDPGPIAAALECPAAWFGMIVDGLHVDPAMLRLALRGKARPMLVTDAMPPVGGGQREFSLFQRRVRVQGEACLDATGTLAGTALDMSAAVRNCVRFLDVPLTTALSYASFEPATFLGLGDRLGRLAPGYRADMVAFEPNEVRVDGTWIAGIWDACPAGAIAR
jgi:N-acetylglucosamine-6-phosphate deacetylase